CAGSGTPCADGRKASGAGGLRRCEVWKKSADRAGISAGRLARASGLTSGEPVRAEASKTGERGSGHAGEGFLGYSGSPFFRKCGLEERGFAV
ncbi:MAG: hypothetical protein RLZZ253_1130, partial [Verrucomicrobiota bacterium]